MRYPSGRAARLVAVAVAVGLCVLSAAALAGPVAADSPPPANHTGTTEEGAAPEIVAVFPDPVADGDRGEYVVVDADGTRNLTLGDGESTVGLPPGGRVALSSAPNATRALVGTEMAVVAPGLELSNAGERLVLERDGRVVDEVGYDRSNEGERLNATTGRWTPRGLRPRPVVATGAATATAFVLPDAPDVPIETLRDADRRILVAGYTFASPRATDVLLAAQRRGVRVRVLLDGGPIGGMTTAQREQLDRLAAGGVDVRLIDGSHSRYAYHHPKYAVVDDRALVLTENWKPAGTGGRDSRGWGVRVDSARTADELAAVFAHDADGIDAVPWRAVRRNASFVDVAPASGSFEARIEPETVAVDRVRVLTAPGNAGAAVRETIADANDSVALLAPRLDVDGPYFAALVAAAERGVRVRLLLSNAWYDEDSNRAVVDRAADLRERGLPIEARIADPEGRFGKVHAKGIVADDTAIVGSLNFNAHSARENREVLLALEGTEPATYFESAFEADWRAAAGAGSSGPA
ncbi:phospholipase D-like domain-containing protein [Halobellus sp. EA9]|uniref:phospholipase D-like domain-containing protein n=1 Tax=Halobellus sp. EA9 TaxID=3421647 RepID=UPI003EBACA59